MIFIKKINERYKGKFTDADIVIVKTLREKLMRDTKLKLSAKTGDPKIFEEKTFPDAFNELAIKSYLESQEIYDSLFKDKAKYNAVMYALCKVIYREMRVHNKIFQSRQFVGGYFFAQIVKNFRLYYNSHEKIFVRRRL